MQTSLSEVSLDAAVENYGMNHSPRWVEGRTSLRPTCLNEVKRVSRAFAMTNPVSTDGHFFIRI